MPRARTKEERTAAFWAQVDKSQPALCWLWKGCKNPINDYGSIWWVNRYHNAHTVAYLIHHDLEDLPPLYEGMKTNIMHICDVRLCCNPALLVIGNTKLNQRDKAQKKRHHMSKRTACKYGHEYTESNTIYRNYPSARHADGTPWNVRYCRECYVNNRKSRRKKR